VAWWVTGDSAYEDCLFFSEKWARETHEAREKRGGKQRLLPLYTYPTQLRKRLAEARNEAQAKQAKIDALMLEYCPEEMTAEQVAEWGRHQRAMPDLPSVPDLPEIKSPAQPSAEVARRLREAMTNMIDEAQENATRYHESMKGYRQKRQKRHARMDADIAQAKTVLEEAASLLERMAGK
jgi:hypothetical protein